MSGQIVKQSEVFKALWNAGLIESGTVSISIGGDQHNPSLEPWNYETTEAMDYVTVYKEGDGLLYLSWMNNDDPFPRVSPVERPESEDYSYCSNWVAYANYLETLRP